MNELAAIECDAAMSPIYKAAFTRAQAVIENKSALFREACMHGIAVELAGLFCAVAAEDFNIVADFKCSLDKGQALARIVRVSEPFFCPGNHIINHRIQVIHSISPWIGVPLRLSVRIHDRMDTIYHSVHTVTCQV